MKELLHWLAFFPISLSALFLLPCFQMLPPLHLWKAPASACLYSKFLGGSQILSVSSGRLTLIHKGKKKATTQELLKRSEQQNGR